jgi:hypothetical protein
MLFEAGFQSISGDPQGIRTNSSFDCLDSLDSTLFPSEILKLGAEASRERVDSRGICLA